MTETTLLSGIPALRYGDPSAVCFIGAVQRLLEALGETVGQDELFALSGVGLCFPWRCGSCCDEVGIIPEIPARTLGAFGYESVYLTGEALADKAAAAATFRKPLREIFSILFLLFCVPSFFVCAGFFVPVLR